MVVIVRCVTGESGKRINVLIVDSVVRGAGRHGWVVQSAVKQFVTSAGKSGMIGTQTCS